MGPESTIIVDRSTINIDWAWQPGLWARYEPGWPEHVLGIQTSHVVVWAVNEFNSRGRLMVDAGLVYRRPQAGPRWARSTQGRDRPPPVARADRRLSGASMAF